MRSTPVTKISVQDVVKWQKMDDTDDVLTKIDFISIRGIKFRPAIQCLRRIGRIVSIEKWILR